ncbi:VOC family protein [Phytohabitans aurantiacus]|uniref:Glyoxalase n=1 Tax=Phytohabitans aurantiacus TaxID=3016789 RepID=A0ABQ5R6X4_9ACTN|nr:VOC family protein [Phytohabitans aurantiacus]GLI01730.1 glyoxalase [Phytohabitans aurantiacus]
MSGIGSLSGVALECPDPAALADFYSGVTGWPIVYADPDWYSVGESRNADLHLSFQRAPGYQPPTWPDPASSMQFHLHFRVDDLDAAERAVVALGATKLDHQAKHRVFADPAGHPFCLCLRPAGYGDSGVSSSTSASARASRRSGGGVESVTR